MRGRIKAPINIKLKNSLIGILEVFKNPVYIMVAIITSFFISGFIIWSLNFELVRYIVLDAPINFYEKLTFFWEVQTGIYTAYGESQATGIIIYGLLFGINTALIVYVLRNSNFKKIPKKSGTAGLIAVMLSGGCIACGTSILAPILATLGATSSIFIYELSNILNWIGIIFILFSIYTLGAVIQNTKPKSA